MIDMNPGRRMPSEEEIERRGITPPAYFGDASIKMGIITSKLRGRGIFPNHPVFSLLISWFPDSLKQARLEQGREDLSSFVGKALGHYEVWERLDQERAKGAALRFVEGRNEISNLLELGTIETLVVLAEGEHMAPRLRTYFLYMAEEFVQAAPNNVTPHIETAAEWEGFRRVYGTFGRLTTASHPSLQELIQTVR